MKNKMICYILIVILLLGNIVQFYLHNYSKRLFIDAVPDEKTAIQIAESVLVAVYGNDVLNERPFNVLIDKKRGVWFISGTLPDDHVGGVAEITIRIRDGKIMRIYHSM